MHPAKDAGTPDPSAILDDPAWFLERVVVQLDAAVFTRTTRQSISETVFLDHRWKRDGAPNVTLPLGALRAYAGRDRPAMIWHTAFCCSTLIADLLDAPGACLAVKEPGVLVDLAAARRAGSPIADDRLAEAVFAQLARSPTPGERVVIKPSNGANALVGVDSGGPALMLYSSCRDFILSVVGGGPVNDGGEERRRFARALMLDRATSLRPSIPWRALDLGMMTDLQVAALLWHAQVNEFRAVARARGPGRVRSLDCADFLADPHRTLTAIDAFLGLGLGEARVEAVIAGSKLGRYAKSHGRAFSAAQRDEELAATAAALGPALDTVVAWSHQVCPATPPGNPVGAPLLAAI